MRQNIWSWSAVDIAAAIRRRQISCVEAVQAAIDRLQAVNKQVNAVTVELSTSALQAARHADAMVASGVALGPLHGVPITIKENVDQQGQATPNGIKAFEQLMAAEDAPIVANLTRPGPSHPSAACLERVHGGLSPGTGAGITSTSVPPEGGSAGTRTPPPDAGRAKHAL